MEELLIERPPNSPHVSLRRIYEETRLNCEVFINSDQQYMYRGSYYLIGTVAKGYDTRQIVTIRSPVSVTNALCTPDNVKRTFTAHISIIEFELYEDGCFCEWYRLVTAIRTPEEVRRIKEREEEDKEVEELFSEMKNASSI